MCVWSMRSFRRRVCDEWHHVIAKLSNAHWQLQVTESIFSTTSFLARSYINCALMYTMCNHGQVQDVTQISGLMSEYIVGIDRSSVFYWLAMRASEMQRKTFLDVLVDVHNTQNKMNALNPCGWSHSMRRLKRPQSKHKIEILYPIEVCDDSVCLLLLSLIDSVVSVLGAACERNFIRK